MTYAVAAAGTGGHVFPALAVAEALVARGVEREEVVFFGGHRLEAEVVPASGFPFVQLRVGGLRRGLHLESLLQPVSVLRAATRMRHQLRERGTTAVLAMGGYINGPAALAAGACRVPLILHEQNAVPGLGSRLAARLSHTILTGFPSAANQLRGEMVGNPLRAAFANPPSREAARSRYGIDPAISVVGVVGGSLGAAVLNRAANTLATAGEISALLHITGRAHLRQVEAAAATASIAWKALDFESQMEWFYPAVNLVVARAGAITISELAATGTPAILVPYQAGTRGHQHANAAYLAEAGAAEVLVESGLDELSGRVAALLSDQDRLAKMAAAAKRLARPGAAARVAEVLMGAGGG